MNLSCQCLIVGGGLSGLACARVLSELGVDWQLLEAQNQLGGRVKSEFEDGFILDRGFQVLNTAYPALHRFLDLDSLELGYFAAGAEVFTGGRFHRIADPRRHPEDLFTTLGAPVAQLGDKLKILELVRFCSKAAPTKSLSLSTEEFLYQFGFSSTMIDAFFRPFFGGVFLENELQTSASKFVTLFSYFARGRAALPKQGMTAIIAQMSEPLDKERIHLGQAAARWSKNKVEFEGGKIKAQTLVLAGWGSQSALLGLDPPACLPSFTSYFSAPRTRKLGNKFLHLNGSGTGSIQTVAFSSAAQDSYSPDDRSLVCVTCHRHCSESQISEELIPWFGESVKSWEAIRQFEIPGALPLELESFQGPEAHREKGFKIICCGDHTETGSIQGALESGRKAALIASSARC